MPLLEELLEARQHLGDDEVVYPRQGAQHGLADNLARRSNIEDWSEHKLRVWVYFRTNHRIGDLEAGNYFLSLERAPEALLANYPDAALYFEAHRGVMDRGRRYRQRAVLVPIIDGLELPNEPRFRPLPAMVRLYAFNGSQDAARNALQGGRSLIFKLLGGSSDRKLYELFEPRVSGRGQGEDHMVEGGSHLMSGLSDQERIDRGEGFHGCATQHKSALTILLTRQGTQLFREKRLAFVTEASDVLLRPIELPVDLS